MNTNTHWQLPSHHFEMVRWRLALQKRYAAAELYDELTLQERELFNKMAPEFIGTGAELALCVRSIIETSRSVRPSAQG